MLLKSSEAAGSRVWQGMVTFERRETAIDHGDNATMRNSGRKGLSLSIFLLENSGSSAGTQLDALLWTDALLCGKQSRTAGIWLEEIIGYGGTLCTIAPGSRNKSTL
jgi:hypothetical protein